MANIWKGWWKTDFDLELARAHLILPKLRANLESLTLLNCNVALQECDRAHRARGEEKARLGKNYLLSQRGDLCKICNCKIWPYESHSIMATGSTHSCLCLSSVHFSRSVVSDSLRLHESQHARPPCPSPTPGVHSDSHPSSQWCHPAISSSVVPFSSFTHHFHQEAF